MLKPIYQNLQNDIDSLLDHVTSAHFSREILQNQIMNVLNETYIALNKLDESRIENEHLGRFENNLTSVKKYIDYYQDLYDRANEQEDEKLKFRYGFTLQIYQVFSNNPELALSSLRLLVVANNMFEIDEEFRTFYINFMSKNNPKLLYNVQRNYDNKDLFLSLYKRLVGYQVTRDKIIKSAGLKIFNFFNLLTKVQKTKLATHLEYLFASLGEDLKLESKHAGSVKVIGEFSGFILFDYMRNKKSELYDFGLEEAFNQNIKKMVLMFKQQGNLAMVRRINNNRKIMEAVLLAQLLA